MSTTDDLEPRDIDEGHSAAEAFRLVADRWAAEDEALGLPSNYAALEVLKSTTPPSHGASGKTPQHLLSAAWSEVVRLWPDALEEGARAVLLVTVAKPLVPDVGRSPHHEAARRRALKKAAAGGPIVALLGRRVVLALLAGVKREPGVADVLRRLTVDRDMASLQVVLATGSTFTLVDLPRAAAAPLEAPDAHQHLIGD